MQTIQTCGPANKRTTFNYLGSSTTEVTLLFNAPITIPAAIFQNVIDRFQGTTVPAGVSMTNPTPGGVGELVATFGNGLTPRHASFICAILDHEGRARCALQGNAILITFP